jgi:uncharacterized DUF497 family protein
VSELRFEWDERKNLENRRKHGVSFDEARTVFYDEWAILVEDERAVGGTEDRFVLLGMSLGAKTLVVCHCYREEDDVIRLISARKANKSERRDYDRRWL